MRKRPIQFISASLFLLFSLYTNPGISQSIQSNYIIQSDMGDTQGNSAPVSPEQWVLLSDWNDVNNIGVSTDWIGHTYQPYDSSNSHPFHLVLDDNGTDYGAVAGALYPIEYRLAELDFDFRVINENAPEEITTQGKIFIVLTTTENDVRSFDPDNSADFELSGHGQLLYEVIVPASFPVDYDGTWNKFSASIASSQKKKYILNKSVSGSPGSPFRYIGIIWESEYGESRLMIDNVVLKDACPDCHITTPLRTSGCFNLSWTTPITNNYYFYSVEIRDSASNQIYFKEIHQPAPFIWDGICNFGPFDGLSAPQNQGLSASVTYYSCLKNQPNVALFNYSLQKKSNCTDTLFGSGKVNFHKEPQFSFSPNPINSYSEFMLHLMGDWGKEIKLTIFDLSGKSIYTRKLPDRDLQSLLVPGLPTGTYILQLQTINHIESKLFLIR